MTDYLHRTIREIFQETLRSIDASDAVHRAVHLEASTLQILDSTLQLEDRAVYAIAIGKAARPMASALTEILGGHLTAGVITAPPVNSPLSYPWRAFAGGHPVPNRESMEAARASLEMLRRADDERALVIFLVSGGGSAMIEMPRDESISLEDLRKLNEVLVQCGAGIEEINAVRRAVSAVKGGGLAARAPNCDQISLIISDTGPGRESAVASGPTFDPPRGGPDALEVISRYELEGLLPQSVLHLIAQGPTKTTTVTTKKRRERFVLLDNSNALEAAAEAAGKRGFKVEIARDVSDQPIAEGCARLLSQIEETDRQSSGEERIVCLISGGEFACPVRGRGLGGRNGESALRWAIELESLRLDREGAPHIVALSAGTDGIDGNSPAAGAVADETTIERARSLNLDARRYLDESDAYSFFHALGDTIVTGPTGTNVRDVRIILAG